MHAKCWSARFHVQGTACCSDAPKRLGRGPQRQSTRMTAIKSTRGQQVFRRRTEHFDIIPNAASTAEGADIGTEADIERDVALLKQAASTRAVPTAAVCQALLNLEKKKLANDSYGDILGGGKEGRRWRLIFQANSSIVQKAKKGEKGGGLYLPISAVQWWQKDEGNTQNGIFLGQIAALVFKGPYEYAKNKLTFDYSDIRLRLGPKWFNYNVKTMKKGEPGPFFLMIYVDDEIVAARGRGGGIALWQRTTPEWELKAGLTL